MSTILMCSTPSRLMVGAIALFRGTSAPSPAAEHDAGYGRKFQPRWFRALPQTVVDPRWSVRWRVLDPLI
ncbi:hypothetical protein [Saccharopolyspora sp. 5N708]|uniref:hypothetical protein n=1 Tax=Saccharopolyspora sp. 5N708 TaxID=3457424 RepID=UPI003FD20BD4